MLNGHFRGQSVFQLVRQFTQLVVAAGCRIPFQGVHDPPDSAHGFRIVRGFLQLERLLIQRLQQFLRALKEDFPQFGHALIGLAHDFTSTRW